MVVIFRILPVLVGCATAFVSAPSPSPHLSSRLRAIEISEETTDFVGASVHFVDAFWGDKAESERLTREQQRKLQRDQVEEFRRRYGGRPNPRRSCAFFVARNDDGEVLGCAGVEYEPALELPTMSNLAVAPKGRRKGLAKQLVKACEQKTKEWGWKELALVVEKKNSKARKLYKKLGYTVISEDDMATTLVPLADGRIVSQTTTTLKMRRDLSLFSSATAKTLAAVVLGTCGALLAGLFDANNRIATIPPPLLDLRRLVLDDVFPPTTTIM